MDLFEGFDWIAILVSTFVAGGLGALWYSPSLFGEAWLAELGKPRESLGPPGPSIAGSVFSCFVSAIAVAWLATELEATGIARGAWLGAVLGLGLVATAFLSAALFSGWSLRLFLIQAGYRVVYLVLMGAIYGGFTS